MMDQQIIQKIDQTLDQLIQNAEALSTIDLQTLNETELAAFQKTQESLLHHLLHMDQLMNKKPTVQDPRLATNRLRGKRAHFLSLASKYEPKINELQEKRSILSKRRKKRFFDPRFKSAVLVRSK
jgi:hypothetical protein